MPDIRLTGEPRRLYEALRDGRFVLLAPEGAPASTVAPVAAGDTAGPPHGRVVHAVPASADLPVLLIRPDGYIAWATDDGNPVSLDAGLRTALAAWCALRPRWHSPRNPCETVSRHGPAGREGQYDLL